MKKYDWKLIIKLNILKLKIVGLWPAGDETYKGNFYTLWAIFVITVFTFGHNFFQTINILFILTDLEAIVATTFVTLPELLGILKAYYVIQNMEILKKLMVALNSDLFQPRNQRQLEIIEPSLKFWKIIYIFYWTASLGAIFFWSTYPIFDQSFRRHKLPFLAWYPYNTEISPFYEITYVYQITGTAFIATTAVSTDTLIAALNLFTGAQFDILADNIRHIFDSEKDIERRLVDCVKHHREILRFAENTNKFFNWIVLAQFFISAVSIGITMFQLTSVVPFSSEFFSLLSFLSSITVEIFMFCWFGNEVELKSLQLPYAFFQCDWTNASDSVKKLLIFMVMKCQTPCKVSALNLFYLTLETFVKILRTAWSYFALLHQVSSRR